MSELGCPHRLSSNRFASHNDLRPGNAKNQTQNMARLWLIQTDGQPGRNAAGNRSTSESPRSAFRLTGCGGAVKDSSAQEMRNQHFATN